MGAQWRPDPQRWEGSAILRSSSRGRYWQIQGIKIKYASRVRKGYWMQVKASKIYIKQKLAKLCRTNRRYSICTFKRPVSSGFLFSMYIRSDLYHSSKNKSSWDTNIIGYCLHIYFSSQSSFVLFLHSLTLPTTTSKPQTAAIWF